jgi:hypothetical protein
VEFIEKDRSEKLSEEITDAKLAAAAELAAVAGRAVAAIEEDCSASWPRCPRGGLVCDCRLRAVRALNAARLYLRADQLAAAPARSAARQPAELAAAMGETRQLRELVTDILGVFGPSGSGMTARVAREQIRKWRTRAGLED